MVSPVLAELSLDVRTAGRPVGEPAGILEDDEHWAINNSGMIVEKIAATFIEDEESPPFLFADDSDGRMLWWGIHTHAHTAANKLSHPILAAVYTAVTAALCTIALG